MKCTCTDDFLCPEAKKLWKLKSAKGRQQYNDHRNRALNYNPDNPRGHFQSYEGLSFQATNSR